MTAGEDLLRRTYDAFNRRDMTVLDELGDPAFEMDLTERVLNPATYRGAEGLQRFLAEVDDLWKSMHFRVERIVERDDDLLAVLVVNLEGRGSGVELESRIAQRWTVRDGRLLRMRLHTDPDAALAEFEP